MSFSSGAPFLSPHPLSHHLNTFCFRLLLDCLLGLLSWFVEAEPERVTRGYKCPPNKTHAIVIRKCQILLIESFWDTRKRGFEFIQVILEALKIYLVTLMQVTEVWREEQQSLWIQSCQSLDWDRGNLMLAPQSLGRNQGGYWESRA